MTNCSAAPVVNTFGADAALVSVADATEAARTAEVLRPLFPGCSVVPGADTVLVRAYAAEDRLLVRVREALTRTRITTQAAAAHSVVIPVRYDGADLASVADLLGVSAQDVVARHTGVDYTVEFLGFAPGFPYLSGLDPFLSSVPRLDTPRTRVPAGSVGLAAGKTCVYPTVSPGGWRLLGSTDLVLFDPTNTESPALLSPGDIVRFEAVR